MTKQWFRLVPLLVLIAVPSVAGAQDEMSFDQGGEGQGETDETMSFDEATPEEGGEEGGAASDLAGLLGPGTTTTEEAGPAPEDVLETAGLAEPDIWAVQQSYVLRSGRFELTPTYGISLNDPFVTHNAFGLALGWYITEVLGVSASFQWYQGLNVESRDNFHIARSFRLVVPINEYQWGANLHFSYVPMYGKFTIFNNWIFHWDMFVEGGVGMLFTRPIPVVDPEVRMFDFGIRVAGNIGMGGRVFITKFVAIYVQLIDYLYMEKLENLDIAPSETTDHGSLEWPQSRFNSATWLGESKFTNDVMFHVGASIFFPFTFDYEFPK